MKIKISIGGATGWVGSVISKSIYNSSEFRLVSVLGKNSAGKVLGDVIGLPELNMPILNDIEDVLSHSPDIFIDYTHPSVVKHSVEKAIRRKVNVVIGTSGLNENDLKELDQLALEYNVGVLAAGNFAITSVLLQKFAIETAKYVPQWEIIDYASDEKPDAPSSTARELADQISQIRKPNIRYKIEKTLGQKEARGANVNGSQIHSLRLPGYAFSFEIIFGLNHQKFILKHEADNSAEPYVFGTLLAAKKVCTFKGLKRGLVKIMDL